jgi:hypothetical protein
MVRVLQLSQLLVALALASFCQNSEQSSRQGLLGAFLATSRDPVVKQPLGSLTGPNHAVVKFEALIVKDGVDHQKQSKGLKVELSESGKTITLYIDDVRSADSTAGSLQHFEQALRDLPKSPPKGFETNLGGQSWAGTVPLRNPNGSMIFNAGIYRRGEESGVRLDGSAGPGRDVVVAYFPGVKLSAVAEFIAAGRAWLDSN